MFPMRKIKRLFTLDFVKLTKKNLKDIYIFYLSLLLLIIFEFVKMLKF
jgi:hypothetical protein